MKISIIIPIYNAENWLTDCLDSVLEQDLEPSQFEVICINDGSTDKSLEILNAYKARHTNVIVINQKNQGHCEATNVGIRTATGKYVYFVNADDFIDRNCLGSIVKWMDTYNIDYLSGKNNKVPEEMKYSDLPDNPNMTYTPVRKMNRAGGGAKIFLREMLTENNLYWDKKAISMADALFLAYVDQYSRKSVGVNTINYYQRIRKSSLSHDTSLSASKVRADGWLYLCDKYKGDSENYSLNKKCRKNFNARFRLCLNYYLFYVILAGYENDEIDKKVKALKVKKYYPYRPLLYSLRPMRSIKQFLNRATMFLFPFEPYYRLYSRILSNSIIRKKNIE